MRFYLPPTAHTFPAKAFGVTVNKGMRYLKLCACNWINYFITTPQLAVSRSTIRGIRAHVGFKAHFLLPRGTLCLSREHYKLRRYTWKCQYICIIKYHLTSGHFIGRETVLLLIIFDYHEKVFS